MNQFLLDTLKLSILLINQAPRHEDIPLNEFIVSTLLTSTSDGNERSASRLGVFSPADSAPGTSWIGGWVGFRADLDAVETVLHIVQIFVSTFYATLIVAFDFVRI
jgi:hypothetical protein